MSYSEQEQKKLSEIAKMDWDEFEERLLTTTRGIKQSMADEEAMRKYFGDEDFEELRKLATRSRATRGDKVLGTVVLLPGIMGSYLSTIKHGVDEGLVWVNFFRLVKGGLKRLKLSEDGESEANQDYQVKTGTIHKGTYVRIVLKLRERWNVQPFAFDWRKDINTASDELARFIKNLKDKPVHLVAHSMGGLVSRNFIHRHKDIWESMGGNGDGRKAGRLIMLGTPNFGSFAIPQTMTGVEKMVRWLSIADFDNGLEDILNVINTFVGTYEMLPAPSRISPLTQAIYRIETWGDFKKTIHERHLSRAKEFHQGLEDPATIDPQRMAYIAGYNQKTLSRMEITAPGKFEYFTTLEGDGRVPHELGLLKDVSTYYVEESHGSLPKNDKVIKAIEELLEHGITSALPDKPTAARAVLADGGRWHRSIGEYQIGSDIERIARRADNDEADAEELSVAEEALMRGFMGQDRLDRELGKVKEKKLDGKRLPLKINVIRGDITQVPAPVVVVGQYKGISASVGAKKALDEALGYWISQAVEQSMIGAELGQLFHIPVNRKRIDRKQLAAGSVLLAGMGEEGRFNQYDLRYLMKNVAYAISALQLEEFATVLIGAGAGNLKEDSALRGILLGISDSLHLLYDEKKSKDEVGLKQVTIVENDEVRYRKICAMLGVHKDKRSARSEDFNLDIKLDIKVTPKELPKGETKKEDETERPEELMEPETGPRITIEREGDVFWFSSLAKDAVIPVRQVELQSFFPEGISDRLMMSNTRDEQETFGRLLNTTLFPEDFKQLFSTGDNEALTLILDRSTASFPWEMTCFDRPEGPAFFGTHLRLTRQFRTLLSSAPGIRPRLNDKLRVLVIADPAPEREYQLQGARNEGLEVTRILNQIKNEKKLDIEVVDRIGAAECDPVEILALILDGNFDVVHFAGHGIFNVEKPDRGGWVFGKDRLLTAREIFRARQVPRLVFANACFSSVVNKGKGLTAEEMNRHFAGIAEAFFERGVQNYIGAGWPVRDDLAIRFATAFYQYTLAGGLLRESGSDENSKDMKTPESNKQHPSPKNLGESLSRARELILHDGSTWGAYHHYGQANAKLMLILKPQDTTRRQKAASKPKGKGASKPKRKKG